jgi:AMP nucleosidase
MSLALATAEAHGWQPQFFDDARAAYERLRAIYEHNLERLRERFTAFAQGEPAERHTRVCYPYVRVSVQRFSRVDSGLSFGFVDRPGIYETTVTRPDIFEAYLVEHFQQLRRCHDVPIEVGVGDMPIPVHFAFPDGLPVPGDVSPERLRRLREHFDVPELEVMDDAIVNGTFEPPVGEPRPLALFTGPRVDFSLQRLRHYTATSPEHFQKFILFTNYQFYIDAFVEHGRRLMAEGHPDYDSFVEPGDRIRVNARLGGGAVEEPAIGRLPQMPAYHLQRPDRSGITMINIGIGPANAKTMTDHVAVLRPHAWIMLGHCAGLRNTQNLGDYVLAHGYVREDHVLDQDLPTWVPIPALAEIQQALEQAVEEVTGLAGNELKGIMRTGTVATIGNRNWELRDHREPVQRFSQSRAIALDMESATVAANGFRFRVPYGTLLCVSDKPLHGELKLPGMAGAFYDRQVDQHLSVGIRAMELLRRLEPERLHSRKLRSFAEVAFQ